MTQVSKLEAAASSLNSGATTQQTLNEITEAGYNLVDINCNDFFNALDRQSNDTEFNRQEMTLGGALAAGTLAAAKASAASIAITALAGTFLGASLDNYQNTELFKEYADQTHQLVTKALASYEAISPPDSAKITNIYISAYYVNGYASLCTYSGIQDLVGQAIQKAPTGNLSQANSPQQNPGGSQGSVVQQNGGSQEGNNLKQDSSLSQSGMGAQLNSPQNGTVSPSNNGSSESAFARPNIGVIQQ